VSSGRGDARTLTATLRVPSARLDAILVTLRALGQSTEESQGGENVSAQMIDLDARLKNSRNTEARLTEMLKNRTGNVGDVLDVEREIARVRGEIEQLDAQRKQLQDRVTYATITLSVSEERQARLDTGTLTIGAQLRNAFVGGMQNVYESAAGALLTLLRVAPVLTFWVIVLWWPIRRGLRAMRTRLRAVTT
jgi:chromosome segregation ATPase